MCGISSLIKFFFGLFEQLKRNITDEELMRKVLRICQHRPVIVEELIVRVCVCVCVSECVSSMCRSCSCGGHQR